MTKMMLLAVFCLVGIGGGVAAKEGRMDVNKPERRVFRHYSVEIPDEFVLERVSRPFMDFDLYRIVAKTPNKILGELFFGNHPAFPHLLWPGMVAKEKTEKGGTTKEFPFDPARGQMEGMMCFPGLTYKDIEYSPWTCVYYYAAEINSDEAAEMNNMIKSIRVVKPHVD
jgi:hypothetical protein